MSDEILFTRGGMPYVAPPVLRTPAGTPYLEEAGVAIISRPHIDLDGVEPFLAGFEKSLGFGDYLADPTELPPAEALVKFAGQACYLSLGKGRTWNDEARRYFDNLKAQGHGSVFEHANFTAFLWGIDRSVTHELVRHRAGFAFSQVSQRYVDGTRLRFVMRPEYSLVHAGEIPELRDAIEGLRLGFERDIDEARRRYEERAAALLRARDLGHPMLQGGSATELRKVVNQVAREGLPNCTEAPIVVTANVRAWRHAIEMRANRAADTQIRAVAIKVLRCLRALSPILFADHAEVAAPGGTVAVETPTRKV